MRYYTKRESDNSEEYWKERTVDPDGMVRNKYKEKEMYLKDHKEIIKFINSLTPGKVLDVGCGLGFLLSAIHPSWEKYGIDPSNRAISYVDTYTSCAHLHTGKLVTASYKDDFFDVVVLNHTIEHMKSPSYNLTKINTLMKNGGKLIVSTPDFDCWVARRFKENFRLLHDKTHISLFSKRSLAWYLIDSGFVIDKVTYPFFRTRHFTLKNLWRLINTNKMSPPFYGNVMTFYCTKV